MTDRYLLEALNRQGVGVRLELLKQGSRFRQVISAVVADAAMPLLESDAPPWQEVVEHQLPDGRSALLLTGAGEGEYWSATVTTLTDVRFALLGFDLARRSGSGRAPMVAYRIAGGGEAAINGTALRVRVADYGALTLQPAPMAKSIATELAPTCRLTLIGDTVEIASLNSPHASTKSTSQWRYELSLDRA